jgi:hypothetical protein
MNTTNRTIQTTTMRCLLPFGLFCLAMLALTIGEQRSEVAVSTAGSELSRNECAEDRLAEWIRSTAPASKYSDALREVCGVTSENWHPLNAAHVARKSGMRPDVINLLDRESP